MMKAMRFVGVLLLTFLAQSAPALAHHTLQKEVSDLLGPQFWGIFLVIPAPFLVIGTIAFLIYRNLKRAKKQRSGSDEIPAAWDPKLN